MKNFGHTARQQRPKLATLFSLLDSHSLPSVTKHTTLVKDTLFCSRDICYYSVATCQRFRKPQAKNQGPRDQQKAPTLSPVRRLPVRTPVYLPPSRPNSVFSVNQSLFATMKFFESQHEFDYSWEEVSTANWRKYCPWNDKTTHVIAVDTISRHVDPTTGIVSFLSNCFTLTSSD